MLWVQEAAGVVEDDDYDPAAEPVAPSAPGEPVITDVLVDDEGETATARAALPGRSPVTIHLRREASAGRSATRDTGSGTLRIGRVGACEQRQPAHEVGDHEVGHSERHRTDHAVSRAGVNPQARP